MTRPIRFTQQWRILVVIGLAWVGGLLALSGASTLPTAPAASLADQAAPVAPVEVKWDRYLEHGKFATFAKLTSTLRNGTTPPSASVAFAFLITDAARRERMQQWCLLLDGPRRAEAIRMLYAELMLAPSDPDVLYQWCVASIEDAIEKCKSQPLNHAGPLSWSLSPCNMASILGYQATSQERFLKLVADAFERILPLRDSDLGLIDQTRGRAVKSWGTSRYAGKDVYGTEITTAGRVTFPIALWIQEVRNDAGLRERYGQQADRFLALIRQTMDEFKPDFKTIPGTEQGYYLHLHNNWVEPVNHMAWAGNCLLTLNQITGEEEYLTMAKGIGAFLRASMWVDEHGCLVWDYMPQVDDRRSKTPEWVWKAAVTIDLPLYFAENDLVFTSEDMQQLCKTFLTNIHQGPHRWNAWLKHEFNDLAGKRDSGGLLSLNHYVELGEYDPRVRDLIEELVATHPDIGGWTRGTYAIMAYAYRLGHSAADPDRSAESLTFPSNTTRAPMPRNKKPKLIDQLVDG